MTQKNRELLSKDLCARLYYGIKGLHRGQVHILKTMDWGYDRVSIKVDGYDAWFPVDSFKPYLRPLSSMTEKENEELKYVIELELQALEGEEGHNTVSAAPAAFEVDFYNKHHFDYRGLIEKGLALETEDGMYKTE